MHNILYSEGAISDTAIGLYVLYIKGFVLFAHKCYGAGGPAGGGGVQQERTSPSSRDRWLGVRSREGLPEDKTSQAASSW